MNRRTETRPGPHRAVVALAPFALAATLLAPALAQPLPPAPPPPALDLSPSAAAVKTAADAAPPPALDCGACGRVESIRQTTIRDQWTPLGTGVGISGAPTSPGEQQPAGVTSFRIGPGLSNQGIVVLGAAGGAAYSKTPTAYERPRWEVTVKLDTGGIRVATLSYEPYVREGDRVRVAGNNVELLDE